MKLAHSFCTLVSALVICSACDRGSERDHLAAAVESVRPYASRFVKFETWAQRACSVADPGASDRALSETVFAPVRNDRGLLAVWIRLGADSTRTISFPPAIPAPAPQRWTDVRDPVLGWVSVANASECPIDAPKAKGTTGQPPCVIVSRSEKSLGGSQPQVTIAFAASPVD